MLGHEKPPVSLLLSASEPGKQPVRQRRQTHLPFFSLAADGLLLLLVAVNITSIAGHTGWDNGAECGFLQGPTELPHRSGPARKWRV